MSMTNSKSYILMNKKYQKWLKKQAIYNVFDNKTSKKTMQRIKLIKITIKKLYQKNFEIALTTQF